MFTDIHSHVIWGVDDGAQAPEETWQMLRAAAADGIGRIICTPHVTPGVYEFPEETFQKHFEEASAFIAREGLPLQLFRGSEILYTDNTPRLLRERKVAPIEFSPTDTRQHILDALQRVSGAGFLPILAHMERYPAIGKTEQVEELKSRCHALVQINARTVTRKQPLLRRRFFDSLFVEGLADFLATDVHALPGRETCMTAGMDAVRRRYGEAVAQRLQDAPEILFRG